MKKLFLKDVPFEKIRHNDLICYQTEGFGGKHIEAWPPFTFFKEYIGGNKEKAKDDFVQWYHSQLKKYHHVPKGDGGMHKGSLYRLVESDAQRAFKDVGEESVQKSIVKRVEQRFSLLEKIRDEGYRDGTELIKGVKKNGDVYLVGGHHRAAILRALGYEILPNVLVFPSKTLYSLYTKLR